MAIQQAYKAFMSLAGNDPIDLLLDNKEGIKALTLYAKCVKPQEGGLRFVYSDGTIVLSREGIRLIGRIK